jgi:hypothetical protein
MKLNLTQSQLDFKTTDGLTWEVINEVDTFNGKEYTVVNKVTNHTFIVKII